MPNAMKLPAVRSSPPKPDWDRVTVPVEPPPLVYSYTLGRLRPRFVTRGAWNELAGLLPNGQVPTPESDALDVALGKLFAPDAAGNLPASFYLARALVWPLVDGLGIPQVVVVPASDEEIVELLANLPTATGRCAAVQSIVRGTFTGFAAGLGAGLDGVPLVAMASVFPYEMDMQSSPGCGGDRDLGSLHRAYLPLLANNGIGDEQRAVNFVLTESKAFYELASRVDERGGDKQQAGARLLGVSAVPVAAPRSRPQMDVVFSFGTEAGAVRQWFQRVATVGPFPFLVTQDVLPYYRGPRGGVRPQELEEAEAEVEASPAAEVWPRSAEESSVPPGLTIAAAAPAPFTRTYPVDIAARFPDFPYPRSFQRIAALLDDEAGVSRLLGILEEQVQAAYAMNRGEDGYNYAFAMFDTLRAMEKANGFNDSRVNYLLGVLTAQQFTDMIEQKCAFLDPFVTPRHGAETHRIQWWMIAQDKLEHPDAYEGVNVATLFAAALSPSGFKSANDNVWYHSVDALQADCTTGRAPESLKEYFMGGRYPGIAKAETAAMDWDSTAKMSFAKWKSLGSVGRYKEANQEVKKLGER